MTEHLSFVVSYSVFFSISHIQQASASIVLQIASQALT